VRDDTDEHVLMLLDRLLIPAVRDYDSNIRIDRLDIPTVFAVHCPHVSRPTTTAWMSILLSPILLLLRLTYLLIKQTPSTIFSVVSNSRKTVFHTARRASKRTTACACKARSATDATEKSSLGLLSVAPFTVLVSLTLFQHATHRFTDDNNADPGLLPPELQDILRDFTQMEEMLCSLASPCFLMWVSRGGQHKARGNVITFSQDISELCLTLPRLPEELDVLVVRRTDYTDSTAYRDFRVRKDKIFRLLRFLKEHNRYYRDITIRPVDSVDLPEDASILDRLPVTERRADNLPEPPSLSAHTESEFSAQRPDSPQLAHEQNTFVPSLSPLPSEQDAITTAMTDSGLASTHHAPLPWPASGPALSEYTTDGLFTMAFPTLFPLGLADISLRRDRKIELHEWAKHLMRYRDSRFATHPRFRFFALNLIFRHRSMQRGKYLFSRNISHHNMTVGQLKEALSRHDGPHLAADIVRCLKTVKATRPYWNMEGGKLRDMIAQIGTPTFFYTLSMADMSWPDLHKLMPDDPFAPGLTPTQSSQIRFHNVATNPHIVASYLSTKHRHLLDTVLQHLDMEDNARVLDFWYRFEWQARGSGNAVLFHHVSLN
jgi:Helitron helicase-like domain at N-terminus